jgi:hypothetical protein
MSYLCCFCCATCQDTLELKELNLGTLPYGPTTETGPLQPIMPGQEGVIPPPGYVLPTYAYAMPPQYPTPQLDPQGYPIMYAGPIEQMPAP